MNLLEQVLIQSNDMLFTLSKLDYFSIHDGKKIFIELGKYLFLQKNEIL